MVANRKLRRICSCALSDGIPRRSFFAALAVGTILNIINQGDAIMAYINGSFLHSYTAGKARRPIALSKNKLKRASGTAELGSCLTDTTREGRSRRAVRDLPLC
jgi:hypothetical protein